MCVCVCVRLFSTNGHFWLTVCFKSILTRTMLLFFFLMFVCSLAANRSLSISLAHLLHWFHQQHLFLSLYIYIYISGRRYRIAFQLLLLLLFFFFCVYWTDLRFFLHVYFVLLFTLSSQFFFFLMCVCVSVCVCVCAELSTLI